jgi:2-C-methyl-D-erythritol 4-phosphate cytidylyltransferase
MTAPSAAREGRSALPTCAVVLAGGTGTRVGLGLPKQLIKVAGKSVIEHTLDVLQASDVIDEIQIVMSHVWIDTLADLLGARYTKLRGIIPGGSTRNDSTRAALAALGDRECKVLFHDAVRPFVDDRILRDCVTALDDFEAVDVVIESADTIVELADDDAAETSAAIPAVLASIPDRSRLRRGQTPQAFLLSTIREAYARADAAGFTSATDDCSVVLRFLPEVRIAAVNGSEENIKITRPLDLIIADRLFQLASRSLAGSPEGSQASLAGKTVVIFGGSYGIGYAVARGAEQLGATVMSFSRSDTQTDIRDADGISDALAKAAAETGGVDAVIISAGSLTKAALMELTDASVVEQLQINLLGPALIAKAAGPYLQKTGGHLVFFTSSSYTRGRAEYSLYSAAKAGVVNLTQALADEWSHLGVKVNCINPERTATPMRRSAFGDEPPESLLAASTVAESVLDLIRSSYTGLVVDVRRDTTADANPYASPTHEQVAVAAEEIESGSAHERGDG